jgi:hypothetical protein
VRFAYFMRFSGIEEYSLGSGGLAGVYVRHYADISCFS